MFLHNRLLRSKCFRLNASDLIYMLLLSVHSTSLNVILLTSDFSLINSLLIDQLMENRNNIWVGNDTSKIVIQLISEIYLELNRHLNIILLTSTINES